MSFYSENPAQLTKAYALFISELEKHISHALEVFSIDGDQIPLSEWSELARAFHNVRGGAGFFGLSEIEKLATQLEARLKQPLQELLVQCDAIEHMVNQLQALKQTLPPPQSDGVENKS